MMKTYARIEDRTVAELFTTSEAITSLFHPSLHWVDVSGQQIHVGWVENGEGTFAPPPVAAPPAAAAVLPSVTEILAELATLKAQVALLSNH
jgi:hypothetical protein